MSIDGVLNARGEWVVKGVSDEIYDECRKMNGFIGPLCDYRLISYICCDPEVMKIAIARVLARHNVTTLLYTHATEVVAHKGHVSGVILQSKNRRTLLTAKYFVDASGDGDVSAMAGAPFEMADEKGTLQPISLMFRMSGVENKPFLEFVRDNSASLAVGESDYLRGDRTDDDLARAIYDQGEPTVFFKGDGPFLGGAIQRGDVAPTALIMIMPTSKARKEVCVNATRVAENIDGTKAIDVSRAVPVLLEQVWQTADFLKKHCPGFENATFAGVAPRVGIRETRRIMGEEVMTGDDCRTGRKRKNVVTKGGHHIDVHGDGTKQLRIPIPDGGSYDIPWGTLIPRELTNVVVAGRCMSSDREANGTTRMMGPCLGMGHAAGTGAAMSIERGYTDIRQLPLADLQAKLREQGAVLEGTH
jgi:hypothetical protein